MAYQPTAKQNKEDEKLLATLDMFSKSICASDMQGAACSFKRGSTKHGGTKRRQGTKRPVESESEEDEKSSGQQAEIIDSPGERRAKTSPKHSTKKKTYKQPTIKQQARDLCEDEENYGEYDTMAKLILIAGTVGVVTTSVSSYFSDYSNALVGVLGLPSLSQACGARTYFGHELLSKIVPGMQSCAEVTMRHEQFAMGAWGSLVAIGAMFRIPMPGNIREVPGQAITAISKALCRYYKERELDQEMRIKFNQLAEALGPKAASEIEEAAKNASKIQSELLSQAHSKRNSPKQSVSPIAVIADTARRTATPPSSSGGKRQSNRRMQKKRSITRKSKKSMRHRS